MDLKKKFTIEIVDCYPYDLTKKKIFLFLFNHKIQNNDDIESIRNKILSQPLIFIYPSPNLNRTAFEVDLSPLLTILE